MLQPGALLSPSERLGEPSPKLSPSLGSAGPWAQEDSRRLAGTAPPCRVASWPEDRTHQACRPGPWEKTAAQGSAGRLPEPSASTGCECESGGGCSQRGREQPLLPLLPPWRSSLSPAQSWALGTRRKGRRKKQPPCHHPSLVPAGKRVFVQPRRLNNAAPVLSSPQSLEPVTCYCQGKRDFAGVIKGRISRWGEYLDDPGGSRVITGSS